MTTIPFKVRHCLVTTIRATSDHSLPDGQIMRIIGDPIAGQPMTMVGPDGVAVHTTPVEEVQPEEYGLGTYVTTSDAVYYLARVDAGGMRHAG